VSTILHVYQHLVTKPVFGARRWKFRISAKMLDNTDNDENIFQLHKDINNKGQNHCLYKNILQTL